jgi:hypothetical protein
MDLKELRKYKIDEKSLITPSDRKHLENYKQLIKFLESSIQNSLSGDSIENYKSLHNSCIQCVRFLDNLIFTYDATAKNGLYLNEKLEKIISDNTPEQSSGNEE